MSESRALCGSGGRGLETDGPEGEDVAGVGRPVHLGVCVPVCAPVCLCVLTVVCTSPCKRESHFVFFEVEASLCRRGPADAWPRSPTASGPELSLLLSERASHGLGASQACTPLTGSFTRRPDCCPLLTEGLPKPAGP